MKEVKGKVAFITGGSSGIGQGIARVLSAAGVKVAFTYLREQHMENTMRHFSTQNVQVLPIHLDVTDRHGMEDAAQQIEKAFGTVDILINNAGINLFSPMDEASYDDWDWVIDVNLKGVINGLITFLPRMKSSGRVGHIVNVGSMGSFISGPNVGIYTTTKFALRGLTESLRFCLAEHRIGVSLLCPGLVASNIHNSDELRPRKYRTGSSENISEEQRRRMEDIQAKGMDPMIVGEKTLQGIKNNDPYIFTHPDHKDELREGFEEILSLIPEEHIDPRRADIESGRRARIKALKELINGMEH